MKTARSRWLRGGLAVVGLVGLLVGGYVFGWIGPTSTPIHASYGYDVSDPEQLFGDASFVIVATVEKDLGRVHGELTAFRVSVVDELKGEVPDVIEVTQDGFRRGRRTWEFESWPLLQVGRTYVLALTIPAEQWNQQRLHVLIGPLDEHRSEVTGSEDPVVASYRNAVANARYPDGFTPEFVASHRELARAWIDGQSGFSSTGPAPGS